MKNRLSSELKKEIELIHNEIKIKIKVTESFFNKSTHYITIKENNNEIEIFFPSIIKVKINMKEKERVELSLLKNHILKIIKSFEPYRIKISLGQLKIKLIGSDFLYNCDYLEIKKNKKEIKNKAKKINKEIITEKNNLILKNHYKFIRVIGENSGIVYKEIKKNKLFSGFKKKGKNYFCLEVDQCYSSELEKIKEEISSMGFLIDEI